MSRRTQIVISIGVAIFGAALFALFSVQRAAAPGVQSTENFEKIGNLVRNNPGQKANVWYLVYEEPGKPALSKELNFTEGSMCTDVLCDTSLLQSGDRVSVTGDLVGERVTVIRLSPHTDTESGVPVQLFYYAPERDKDETGNLMCSRAGLVPALRVLPKTENVEANIRAAIELLLRGELTEEERAAGIGTEFPLSGLTLKEVQLEDRILTLTFDDPEYKTSGGSCRAGILWFQIEATAKQFTDVRALHFYPEELFQP